MARIQLMSGFVVIPEGEYRFTVNEVEYDEAFGTMKLHMTTEKGQKHTERYSLKRDDDTVNDGVMMAFSIMAHNLMNNADLEDIDPQALVGRSVYATVQHDVRQNRNDPSKTVTFVKLTNTRPVEDAGTGDIDLAGLLGE